MLLPTSPWRLAKNSLTKAKGFKIGEKAKVNLIKSKLGSSYPFRKLKPTKLRVLGAA